MNRKIGSIIAVAGGVLIAALVGLYMGRNVLLEQVVRKRIRQVEVAYGLQIEYGDLHLNGLDKVVLRNLSVVPDQRDTLVTMQSLDVRLNFWQLIRAHVEVENVRLSGLNVTLTKQDSVANYDFLFRKQSSGSTEEPREVNYAQQADRVLDLLYRLLPTNGDLHRVCITQREDTNFVKLTIPSFVITDNRFRSEINVLEDTLTQHWTACGELNRGTQTLKTELYARGRQKVSVPYIRRRLGAMIRFDTLAYSLTKTSEAPLNIAGQARVSGLDVFHKALSPEAIRLDRGQLTYRVNLFPGAIELDSATVVRFNRLEFHPYLQVAKSDGEWHYTASIRKPWFPADELFASLPTGLFTNLDGLRTSGSLAYTFLLDVDFARLDSLKLVSELKEKDFRIVKYGATNLSKMSEEFVYTAYENGQPVRSFPVG
ncbi:MAG: penicillin-binding protein, partial [Bacteroides sp.]